MILTWSIATRVPNTLVSVIADDRVHHFMKSPTSSRVTVITGFNKVSVALSQHIRTNPKYFPII